MKKISLIILATVVSFSLRAEDQDLPPSAVVHKIIGTVTLDGKSLKAGDKIDKSGLIETREKSLIQMKIEKWNNTISIGPLSKMTLDLQGEKKYTLDQGVCRWKTDVRNQLKESSKGKIFTRNVSMGVRGTDFLVKSFPLFGESEIIMLDGEVQLENLEDSSNSFLVKKGQWGGLGGRYGKKIAPPIDIPALALGTFEKLIEAP